MKIYRVLLWYCQFVMRVMKLFRLDGWHMNEWHLFNMDECNIGTNEWCLTNMDGFYSLTFIYIHPCPHTFVIHSWFVHMSFWMDVKINLVPFISYDIEYLHGNPPIHMKTHSIKTTFGLETTYQAYLPTCIWIELNGFKLNWIEF